MFLFYIRSDILDRRKVVVAPKEKKNPTFELSGAAGGPCTLLLVMDDEAKSCSRAVEETIRGSFYI